MTLVVPQRLLVKGQFVAVAITHLQIFFDANGIIPDPIAWVRFGRALREQTGYDFSPYWNGIYRVSVITPRFDDDKRVVVLVFKNPSKLNQELTDALNEKIRRDCGDKWETE